MHKLYFILLITFPTIAHAYLDPGTGSIIFQTLLAIIFGIPIFLKTLRQKVVIVIYKIFTFFKKR